jgi:threonine dehydrogenase-like Zn-dependent dehydrogenase
VLCQVASEPREHHPIGGGFGDTFVAPASSLVSVPDDLPNELVIFTEPVAVALHAAWRRRAAEGDKVMVLGCGTIGYLLIQVVRLLQPRCEITAVAQFPWQAEIAREYGANHVFLAGEDGYSEVARITGASLHEGRGSNRMLLGGFDLVFDAVGIETTLNSALRWTRAGGAVVLVGVNLHRMNLDVTPVWYQEVDLLGAVGHDVVQWKGKSISTFELAMRWMQTGQVRCDRLLTHRYPLVAYRQAFATAVDKQNDRSIKVAFDLEGTFVTG